VSFLDFLRETETRRAPFSDFAFKEQYIIGEAEQCGRRAAEKTVAVPEGL
jgi:hypothetical protein